ncbi:MAG: TraR/DksA family transcriptional regulator [Pseudolabrys sp.]|nr:TraR/DksA family transcriptional regulator [Pseudolabrys sp.]
MNKLISAPFRARLEAMLAELIAERDATVEARAAVELDQQSVGRLSRIDAMQQQQMALAAGRQRDTQIARIRNALDRMAKDEFGYCITCGEDIPEPRLAADPAAHLCVACAAAAGR